MKAVPEGCVGGGGGGGGGGGMTSLAGLLKGDRGADSDCEGKRGKGGSSEAGGGERFLGEGTGDGAVPAAGDKGDSGDD